MLPACVLQNERQCGALFLPPFSLSSPPRAERCPSSTPCLSLPLLIDADDMPMGVQLVAARGNDTRLLRTAQWLHDWASGDYTTTKETS